MLDGILQQRQYPAVLRTSLVFRTSLMFRRARRFIWGTSRLMLYLISSICKAQIRMRERTVGFIYLILNTFKKSPTSSHGGFLGHRVWPDWCLLFDPSFLCGKTCRVSDFLVECVVLVIAGAFLFFYFVLKKNCVWSYHLFR